MEFDRIYHEAEQRALPMGSLTVGDCIELAQALHCRVSDVVLAEAAQRSGLSRTEVLEKVLESFGHNLHAADIGAADGHSFIMGTVGHELSVEHAPVLLDDPFVNDILVGTLAAQVGNHEVGMQPCAGTGDSCPYTGFIRAMLRRGDSRETIARVAAVVLKVGTLFRVGKVSTGCNMEGLGAGAAALAAGFVELEGGSPEQMGKAMTLALSPTLGVPCTPRVMVPGLCSTHIGGGVLLARLASSLVMRTKSLNVTVPVDVMMAAAASIHTVSAKYIVPDVIRYMEPFFKTHEGVERYIAPDITAEEKERKHAILEQAKQEARTLASKSNPIIKPFGPAVVGGSSQAVGSPTNTGRIVYALAEEEKLGKPNKVIIDLYPELFARRGINVPGILMAAVYGSDTTDGATYRKVMDMVQNDGVDVEIRMEPARPQLQRVTAVYQTGSLMVEALNRGGARLALVDSSIGLERARAAASRLGIDVVD